MLIKKVYIEKSVGFVYFTVKTEPAYKRFKNYNILTLYPCALLRLLFLFFFTVI